MPPAQHGETYAQKWKQVDEFANKGLPKSALDVVNEIYTDALKNSNAAQTIKALLHQMKFRAQFEDDHTVNQIKELESALPATDASIKPVIQSILAQLYWGYYNQNRYQILDRTETGGDGGDDLQTWDAGKFVDKVIWLYNASLEERTLLQMTPLTTFDAILNKENHSADYRPTLYDFLAHRAVDFLMNEDAGVTRPADQFRIRDTQSFADAASFIKQNYNTEDTRSLKFHALKILQELTRFHLRDDDPSALVDVELKRLAFADQNSIHPQKSDMHRQALETLEKRYAAFPVSTQISFQLAQFYNQRSFSYQPGQGPASSKWDRKTACEIAEAGVRRFPGSPGAKNCQALLYQVETKELSVELEQVNLPNAPFRALISYRNIDRIYLRAVMVTPEAQRDFDAKYLRDRDKLVKQIAEYKRLPAAAQWEVSLPDDGDFYQHRTEIKIPALPGGRYVILAGTSMEFSIEENATATGVAWVSNLGFYKKETSGNATTIYVFDRHSGKPLKDVKMQVWISEYDRTARQNIEKKGSQFTSDSEGKIVVASFLDQLTPGNRQNSFKAEFIYKDDRLFLDETLYSSRYGRDDRPRAVTRTFFFTDRTIYRPGQQVFFKGIVIRSQDDEHAVEAGAKSTARLTDVNAQEVSTLQLQTNEYGSFAGTFTLPTGGITGQFTISNEHGQAFFSVEEYKRPRFEVTFEPAGGSFKLNETARISGSAEAYAGAAVDAAEVSYRVYRRAVFPPWWYGWRIIPPSEEVEISSGTLRTDAKGKFTIEFKAVPDPSIPEKDRPTFTYQVQADITDIGGETQSNSTSLTVGYVALDVDLALPESIDRENIPEIAIATRNLNGEFEAAEGTIRIITLEDPGRVLRDRLWAKPDTFVIDRAEYVDLFPNDVYDDEDDFRNWKRGGTVSDNWFDTGVKKTFTPDLSQLEEGKYLVELKTKDRFGKEVEVLRFFSLYSLKEKDIPAKSIFWSTAIKQSGEPGETAEFVWGSAAGDVYALFEVYHKQKIVESRWIKAGDKKNQISLPIKEAYRGNFAYSLFLVTHGRVMQHSQMITVPWSNKELTIKFETFRDKLKPGQNEEWRLRISGPDGDRVTAEMVAAMYDASLDAFAPHSWNFYLYESSGAAWMGHFGLSHTSAFSEKSYPAAHKNWNPRSQFHLQNYDELNWFGYYPGQQYLARGAGMAVRLGSIAAAPAPEADAMMVTEAADNAMEKEANADQGMGGDTPVKPSPGTAGKADDVQVRSNLNETAFFFPQIQTNAEGELILSFTMPEALTRWKLLGFAHTQELKYAMAEQSVITQKELMVTPNAPRFLRESDRIRFSGKVSNLTGQPLSGSARLELFDAITMKPVNSLFNNANSEISFSADAGQSAPLEWALNIPENTQAVTYRIIAFTDQHSDGEESTLPVLTNRMLVTESLPLPISGKGSKSFSFDRLKQSGTSTTLKHQLLTLEFTSNPAWYAIQALPYMMEYPYECSEQVFSRFYANSIAEHVARSSPKIKRVFDSWKSADALVSNLEKNQELKSLLLEETPWVLQARDESERKKRVGLLFDLNRMSSELSSALRLLEKMQSADGGWPWFSGGGRSSVYITQHIVSGLGHLGELGITRVRNDQVLSSIIQNALSFIDAEMYATYQRLLEQDADLDKQQIGRNQIHYLYTRSFFRDQPLDDTYREAFDFWNGQAKKYWLNQSIYMQAMIALALHRNKSNSITSDIVASLKERSTHTEEMGMYWKDIRGGYYWYEAPIETQSLLIELFSNLGGEEQAVNEMRLWLLKQKQTQDWKTTKATAEACYALLLQGTEWLVTEQMVSVSVGGQVIDPAAMDNVPVEAGTGYFKTNWGRSEITASMADVTVTKAGDGPAWGALYWQYFEQLDKITTQATPLKLKKALHRQVNSSSGPRLEEISPRTALKPGDLIKVRIELRVDRDMEYVHMKDMRASALEPLNVFSTYKYQDGLAFYESTRDASTNFFFPWLAKGTYVFEYPLRVTHNGDFSNGITTIQCMYAPEFTAHSEGIRIAVGD